VELRKPSPEQIRTLAEQNAAAAELNFGAPE
jgi:hypothetical protein